jgi:hypothetical protein
MFRFVFELIGLLIFFSVVRTVITWALRLFAGAVQGTASSSASAPGPMRNSSVIHSAGELQKDPVCGTFVPVATSLKRVVSGHPVYFCSAECRDRY